MTTTDTKPNFPSWEHFSIRNLGNPRDAFEDLCKGLFGRRLGISPADLVVHKNQTGIECEPYQKGTEYWSFQAKYKQEGPVDFPAFRDSIKKALDLKSKPGRYDGLTNIMCYTNKIPSEDNEVRDKIKELSQSAGVNINWVYGNAILDRVEESKYVDLRKKYFGGGKDLKLSSPKSKATKSISALKFTAQVTKFVGRDAEREQLTRFMSSKDLLSWWAIEGQGASGKSRLALELCDEYSKKGWKCGFYVDVLADRMLPDWDPERGHLIIFDYAFHNEDQPIKVFNYVIDLMEEGRLSFPIRILLLDRDVESCLKKIDETRTFGEKIKGYRYAKSPLALGPPSDDDILKMISDMTAYFELSPEKCQFVTDYTLQNTSTRKVLIAGLASLSLYKEGTLSTSDSMKQIVNNLIKREREISWRKLGFSEKQEEYLLVATIAGGIDRQNNLTLGTDARSFINDFSSPDEYEKIVGQSTEYKLAPLSHDLVNELYVLSTYSPINSAKKEKFNKAIKICLHVKGGHGLVEFFTRAANDWPNHPALNLLLPRFGQTEAQFTIWLVVISNIIDKINIPIDEKLEIFSSVVRGLIRDSESTFNKLKHVFEGFFLRVLREASKNNELDEWVRDYIVLDASTRDLPPSPNNAIPSIEVTPGLKLRSDDYCKAVVSSFVRIEKPYRNNLIWHGLFETYFHFILHRLVDRNTELKEVSRVLSDISETFNDSWSIGIMFRDIIAALVQFNHVNNNPDQTVEIINWTLDEVQKRENKSGLASCLSAATTAFSLARVPYDKKKEILLLFDDTFRKDIEVDEKIGTEFVGATVALMHGFRDRSDFDFASDLASRAEHITDIYPNDKNVDNLNMVLGQLARRVRDIATVSEADTFLSKTISLAKRHGERVPRIVVSVVRDITNKYENEIQHNYQKAHKYFEMVVDLCEVFSCTGLENNKLYPIGLLEGEFNFALESRNFVLLCDLVGTVNKFQKNKAVDISHFWQTTTDLYSFYISAKNKGDYDTANEVARIADYWLEHLYDNSSVIRVFSHIVKITKT